MITIYKYEIPVTDEFEIELPENATVLCVQIQNGKPYIWVHLFDGGKKEKVKFKIFGTGHELPIADDYEYVGTFQVPPYVWHLFRITN
jgi:hypothetical protein